jgi:spore maturation protein CgeB
MNAILKQYRSQFRIWQNNRKLAKERSDYTHLFDQSGLKIPEESDLQNVFKQRFPQIAAKLKDQLNIIAIYHHYNWENYSLKPALEQFGTVRHYDWFGEFNHQVKNWHKSQKELMNKAMIARINQWMSETKADVIFTYLSGELVQPETLKTMRKHHVPLVNLALNDKEHFVSKIINGRSGGARDICRYFDLCWTSTEDALIKYCVEGALPIYLPEGANPDIHKPYNIEKTIDVSFVGQCYGNRAEVIGELEKSGIAVMAYGSGWPNGPLSAEDMVKMYSRSKINLGFGGVAGHGDTFCLKGRDFEIPMSGGFYLTEDHPELSHVFRPGEEIATYSDLDDLIQKIHFYLSHPAQAEGIRKRGYERALREHTWQGRFKKIFRLIGLLN